MGCGAVVSFPTVPVLMPQHCSAPGVESAHEASDPAETAATPEDSALTGTAASCALRSFPSAEPQHAAPRLCVTAHPPASPSEICCGPLVNPMTSVGSG